MYEPREFIERIKEKHNGGGAPGLPVISSPKTENQKSMPMPRSKVNIRELRDQEREQKANEAQKKQQKDILSTRTSELKAIKSKVNKTAPTTASPVKAKRPKGTPEATNSAA